MERPMIETQVVIVGAGPTGLTLALDLGRRGIKAVLVERHEKPLFLPKMERTNPRTMEIFRRLGVADEVRAVGYPADVAMDTFILTSLAKNDPLVHLKYPSVQEAKVAIRACDDGSMPLEPYQLVSQYALEPLLLETVKALDSVTVLQSATFASFSEDEAGVTAMVSSPEGEIAIRAKYLVAADGGRSSVRKQLGIKLGGSGVLATVKQVFFRCDDFYEKCQTPAGRHYSFANKYGEKAGVGGVIIVQGDRRHFTLQTTEPDGTDWVAEIRRVTGLDINPEILYAGDWNQNLMLAETYVSEGGRVLLAGDAVHLFIPVGGLGMNTAVGDAFDLSWKLAGTLQGWGGPELLASYDTERRAVGMRNQAAADSAMKAVVAWRAAFSEKVVEDSEEGRKARAAFAAIAEPLNRHVYEMKGTELGYRYVSQIITAETGTPPPDDIFVYAPSTWPGCRLPHVWRENGEALHDQIGAGYTLLKMHADALDTSELEGAMRKIGAPLEVLHVNEERISKVFETRLVLVRPDLHVCWRGDAAPDDAAHVARLVTGHAR
jgi:2-polyprenyl-6-methoxyphenol hydroxylase-like FAD-dependent oxidoreductase